jgi:DNA modification methylase
VDKEILNNIHVGYSPNWLIDNLEDNSIHLTITSPPIYDDNLYILDNGQPEFGWRNYEEYRHHLEKTIEVIFKKTVEGGMLILDTSSGPREGRNHWIELFPIPADIILAAKKFHWKFRNEVIWERKYPLYTDHNFEFPPNVIIRQKHHQILFFQKGESRNPCSEEIKFDSVWRFNNEASSQDLKSYNEVYQIFPDELLNRLILTWSCPSDIILDAFAGSGQVMRIAKALNRRYIGVEADSKWENLWKDI